MRKSILYSLLGIVALGAALTLLGRDLYNTMWRPSRVVILSTNDMHANIDNFARLATAVRECRDTVFTILVDAGDRWTGNAYIDLAENRRPIIDLMNHVGYNAATLGNHEFDVGTTVLGNALSLCNFDVVCANLSDTADVLPAIDGGTRVVTPEGVRFDIVGAITNYDDGHPDGDDANFEGLTFGDPQQQAIEQARSMRGDIRVLLSHMGDDRDMELAAKSPIFDLIIGGHTHRVLDTLIHRTVIGQTGRKLRRLGVTQIELRGRHIQSIDYKNIDLSRYAEDEATKAMIEQIEQNPDLQRTVGTLATPLNKVGLGNLQTMVVAKATGADIGLYHRGGVRLDELQSGPVTVKQLFDNEPFFSQIYTAMLTPEQLRDMILAKYNDTTNAKESHRIDIYASVPYTIVVDHNNTAYDVLFPTLTPHRAYRVAMPDYMAENYPTLDISTMQHIKQLVYDLDVEYFNHHSPVRISNTPKQQICKR